MTDLPKPLAKDLSEVAFRGQKDNELVMYLFRRSPLCYISSVVYAFLLIIAPFIIQSYIHMLHYFWFLWLLGWVPAFYLAAKALFLWRNNLFLITNLRVLAVNQDGFFTRRFSESYLESICQITAKVTGPLQHSLDFGDVLVQTEAEQWLIGVEHPYEVKTAIFEAIGRSKKTDGKTRDELKKELFWRGE